MPQDLSSIMTKGNQNPVQVDTWDKPLASRDIEAEQNIRKNNKTAQHHIGREEASEATYNKKTQKSPEKKQQMKATSSD